MTKINLAIWYLNLMLLDGPVPSTEIVATGIKLGFSKRTLERAKRLIKIKSISTYKFEGIYPGWKWTK